MLARAVVPSGGSLPVVDVEGLIGLKLQAGNVPPQGVLRPEHAVQSLEEFVAFLAEVEAVVGRDERPRPPTIGRWFRL